MRRPLPPTRIQTSLQAALLLFAGCSFQSLDYLQEGGGGSSAGGGDTSTAGTSGPDPLAGTGNTGEGGVAEPGSGGMMASAGTTSQTHDGGEPMAGTGGTSAGAGSGGGGTGAVGQLVNPSFETSNTSGWKVEPAEALSKRHAFVQVPQGQGTTPDGIYQFSTWHGTDDFTVEIFQTITGLEDGHYTFKGYFSRGDLFNEVTMFARNCSGADLEPLPVPLTEPTQWLAVSLTGIEVVGGNCEVGIRIDSNATNWLNADLFSFEKEPEPESEKEPE